MSGCHGDATSLLGYLCLLVHCMFVVYTMTELPIFRPNEFFWENHWDGKEQKWDAYARAVRQIMIEAGNFEESENTMEDKIEYKNLVRKSMKSKNK